MNYYAVLKIAPTANVNEIKQAFRKLSLKLHPDKDKDQNGNDFVKLREAYVTLVDTEKRAIYDKSFTAATESPLSQFVSQHPIPSQHIIPSPHLLTSQQRTCLPIVATLNISLSESLKGGGFPLKIERQIFGEKECVTVYVNVKAGIDNNEIIVIPNEGHIYDFFTKGDIRVIVSVNKDPLFQRKGLDLIYTQQISLKDALCGFQFHLTLPLGKVYTINNRRGNIIFPNFQKVISNLGVTRDNLTGDLIIVFDIVFPKTLCESNIEAISKLL